MTVLSHLTTVVLVTLCTGHRDTMSSKRSKHNTDHAAHRTDYSRLCLKLHGQAQISGYCEWLHLHTVRNPTFVVPRHACTSFSLDFRNTKQINSNDGRRRFLLLTESQAVTAFACAHVCCITSSGQEVHDQIYRALVAQCFVYMLFYRVVPWTNNQVECWCLNM